MQPYPCQGGRETTTEHVGDRYSKQQEARIRKQGTGSKEQGARSRKGGHME